ncbi:ectonucleotide pyrophosphatase/phosphodiesterase family member 6-like [Limulus polyphemus]|uniref:glycerophosphocholine cholinephosphodiesterase n=1 Tax=Limulus polyphemus TaxID=6850 RepID=A0ABM1SAW2_LIMPO|nr:ectonucleotide pyrophosphatase/phosphodiesterase family member 6-like [Limulus polyphemus]
MIRFCSFTLCVILAVAHCSSAKSQQKLLLILVDGCRWNYVDEQENLLGFRRIAEHGVRAEFVTPIYPSNSYPNWYTIVTGLYAENHGFVENYLYDPVRKDFFLMAPDQSASETHWWNQAEPLWITAKKSNLRSALYWWDGCQVEIRGEKPNECIQYKSPEEWDSLDKDVMKKLNETLDKFERDEIDLVQLYYEAVDANGHSYGPDSDKRKEAFARIDRMLDLLQTEIEERDMTDKINLVIVSDHGMTSTDPKNGLKVINISTAINPKDLKYMIYYGASCMIVPTEEKEDKLYEDLSKGNITGLQVYKKEDLPEKYHIKGNSLTTPIVLMADPGYYIIGLEDKNRSIPISSKIYLGSHGYDPDKTKDMRTIFFARGPALKKGYKSGPIHMVDHYNLLCHLLNIKPLPNNGSWENVKSMLNEGRNYYPLTFFQILALISALMFFNNLW